MKGRRDFLRASLVSGALAAVGALGIPEPAKPADKQSSDLDFPWCRTIYCQFDHQALKKAIEDYARSSGCLLTFGEPYSNDIHAAQGFVYIIDRATLKPSQLDYYDRCLQWNSPCILTDWEHELPNPERRFTVHVNMKSGYGIETVLENVIIFHEAVALRKIFAEKLRSNYLTHNPDLLRVPQQDIDSKSSL